MTDNEIKKALECHADPDVKACKICPYEGNKQCPYLLSEDALDLINRQQAEIERLKDENLQSEYPARIRVDDFLVCANSLGEWLEFCDSLKAEAIKEFADRLKEKSRYPSGTIYVEHIDNLVKKWWVMRSEFGYIKSKRTVCLLSVEKNK